MSRKSPTKPAAEFPIETEVTRDLGLISALAIGVGTMIAAGIFTLSGLAVGYVGSAAIASFMLAAVVATFTALSYCEFTSIYPESGEGYLYARRTFTPPLAYIAGWCLLLGYSSSCGFYIASFSSYFNEFIWHAPFEMLSGLIVLGALTLLNIKGTKESGTFQVVVTGGKVLLLIWFIIGGVGSVDPQQVLHRFSTDIRLIGNTAALVFITFFGFSAIAASAGEIRNPKKTIPRAIFISMGVVTVIYAAVVLCIVAANLSNYSEAAMGEAARNFLGPIGGMVIVTGALFSMLSASNASILAGSRVALSMSKRGHLPQEIGTINLRTRTPVIAVILVGGAVGTFSLVLPLEDLAHYADCMLLVALILVNLALIVHRRKFPHLERPFRVPLVPLLPILGILANLYLLSQTPHLLPPLLAAGSVFVGFVGLLAWKGSQVEVEALPGRPSRVALEHSFSTGASYHVLVPLANPANLPLLVDLAGSVAAKRDGELVLLRVVVLPEQVAPATEDADVERQRAVLEEARQRARTIGVRGTSLVRVGHSAARAILETARERRCQLIVLGWRGATSTARRILGEVTDDVVNHARSDIMLVKLVGTELPKRILLPSAGGAHARRALEYAACIAAAVGGELTLCGVIGPDDPEEHEQSEEARLKRDRDQIAAESGLDRVEWRLLRHRSVVEGILAAAPDYDAIVIGAAGQSFSSTILFGSIPETIAVRAECTVIVVKRHDAVKALYGRVMTE